MTGKTQYRRFAQVVGQRFRHLLTRPQTVSTIADNIGAELNALLQSETRTLLLFSGTDRSFDFFRQVLGRGWERRIGGAATRQVIEGAEHTFTSPEHQRQVLEIIAG